jgi:dihydroneopterin aldolase
MDVIFLREFKFDTLIGVHDYERRVPQTIQLDLDIGLPHSHACQSDRVEDTIDYSRVVARIKESLEERHCALVEAVAEHVARLIIDEFGSPWVKVTVTKLGLVRGVKYLGCTIERGSNL